MFGLQILDVLLGLTFVFLVLSLVCTVVAELIAQWFDLRTATLAQGVQTMLTGTSKWATAAPATAAPATAAPATAAPPAAGDNLRPVRNTLGELSAAIEQRASKGQIRVDVSTNPVVPEADLLAALYAHPLVRSLSQRRRTWWGKLVHLPAYIPPKTFARALLDVIARSDAAGNWSPDPIDLGMLRQRLQKFRAQVARPLLNILDEHATAYPVAIAAPQPAAAQPAAAQPAAPDVYEDVVSDVAAWYEDAMERVSGLYKRKTQLNILLIGLIVVIATNADTVRMTRALWTNAQLRDATVAMAQGLAANTSADVRAVIAADSARRVVGRERDALTDSNTRSAAIPSADTVAAFRLRQLRATLDSVEAAGMPLGWTLPDTTYDRFRRELAQSAMREQSGTQTPTAGAGVPAPAATSSPAAGANARLPQSAMREQSGTRTPAAGAGAPAPAATPSPAAGTNGRPLDSWGLVTRAVGWHATHDFPPAIPGLLVTAFALSLGAPFWFDMLNRIVNIRSAGRAPEERSKPPKAEPPPRGEGAPAPGR